jgi:hypothetical protein
MNNSYSKERFLLIDTASAKIIYFLPIKFIEFRSQQLYFTKYSFSSIVDLAGSLIKLFNALLLA